MFERGTVERAARDKLAARIKRKGGAADPFAVATRQVQRLARTKRGRAKILRLASAKKKAEFRGPHPEADYRETRRKLGMAKNPEAAEAMRLHQKTGISLKAAWARVRGHGGGGGGGKSMKKKAGDPPARKGLGVAYQSAKLGVQIAAPAIQELDVNGPTHAGMSGIALRYAAYNPTLKTWGGANTNLAKPFYKGMLVRAVDLWGEKKIGHTAAIGRKSVTALVPEGLAVLRGAQAGMDATSNELSTGTGKFSEITTGHNPKTNTFSLGGSDTKIYFLSKYGLGAGRKVVNRSPALSRLVAPLKRILGEMGGAL